MLPPLCGEVIAFLGHFSGSVKYLYLSLRFRYKRHL